MNEVLKARDLLESRYGVPTDVWSITSYKELYRDMCEVQRQNRLNPEEDRNKSYITECLEGEEGVFIAATDYLKSLPDSISNSFPRPLVALGTDGFGRSDTREALRDFFEVDYRHIAFAALSELYKEGSIDKETVSGAASELGINRDRPSPVVS